MRGRIWSPLSATGAVAPEAHTDCFENPNEVPEDIRIAEANDPIALRFKRPGAVRIGLPRDRMLPAIHFHDQPLGRAREFDDVWSDGMLTPKLDPVELPVS